MADEEKKKETSPEAKAAVKALKEKARKLQAEKAGAREKKEPKRLNTLRRRINRLKKQTRRAAKA